MGEGGLFLSPGGLEKLCKKIQVCMKVLDEIKATYSFEQLQNCIRVNGILDIYLKKKTGKISIFLLPTKEWYYPGNEEDFADYAINQLEFYIENPHLKKTGKPLTDEDEMMFWMHAGEKLGALPASYCIWLLDKADVKGRLLDYLQHNEKRIRMEASLEKRGIR
jgi:hypothetical protein